MPRPIDLTPADTSSVVVPGLAAALRAHHSNTDEIVIDQRPSSTFIADVVAATDDHDVIIVGTIEAERTQGNLVSALLGTQKPVVTVALRPPYNLSQYPAATTHLCTYGIHPPSLDALASALFGFAPIGGKLPVSIPGLCSLGHGLEL